MAMGAETLAPGWRAIPLGPWERYRRDLDDGRRVIVARGTYGGWVWDLWGTLDGSPRRVWRPSNLEG
jgi:hypothetical protein